MILATKFPYFFEAVEVKRPRNVQQHYIHAYQKYYFLKHFATSRKLTVH
jgi:hypothetical protein